jgi:BolA protein
VSTERVARITERLRSLEPSRLEVRDDSAAHAGHAGAREGGHFHVRIVSRKFAGLAPLARHRLVFAAVADLMGRDIHALSIDAAVD